MTSCIAGSRGTTPRVDGATSAPKLPGSVDSKRRSEHRPRTRRRRTRLASGSVRSRCRKGGRQQRRRSAARRRCCLAALHRDGLCQVAALHRDGLCRWSAASGEQWRRWPAAAARATRRQIASATHRRPRLPRRRPRRRRRRWVASEGGFGLATTRASHTECYNSRVMSMMPATATRSAICRSTSHL